MARPARTQIPRSEVKRVARATLAFAVLLGLMSASVRASEHAAEPEGEAPREIGTPGVPTIDMPPLIAPVIVNGELAHYVHFSVSLKLTSDDQKTLVLKKVPYLQDAFLREVHGPSIALDNNPEIVDEKGLLARLMAVGAKILGPDVLKTIEFRNVVRSS